MKLHCLFQFFLLSSLPPVIRFKKVWLGQKVVRYWILINMWAEE